MSPLRYAIAAAALGLFTALPAAAQEDAQIGLGTAGVGLAGVLLIALCTFYYATRFTNLIAEFGTAVGAFCLAALFGLAATAVLAFVAVKALPAIAQPLALLGLAASTFVSALAVKMVYGCSYKRALGTYFLHLVLAVAIAGGLLAIAHYKYGVTWSQTEKLRASLEENVYPWLPEELTGMKAKEEAADIYEAFTYPLSSAQDFVGYRVRLVLDDGSLVEGTLDEVRDNTLVLRESLPEGTVSMPIYVTRIVEFQQLVLRPRE